MRPACPRCRPNANLSDSRHQVVRAGFFRRKSDSKTIQRLRCKTCRMHFSYASSHPCFRQHKRHINDRLNKFLCSAGSQRRAARIFHISRTTVLRKLVFLGQKALAELRSGDVQIRNVKIMEFDDLETFEHTKYKPLSITVAVADKKRRLLDFEVSQMPAKGMLAAKAIKKYGYRKDRRDEGRRELFTRLKGKLDEEILIKSDENPHYIADVKTYFPHATHERHKGQRGVITAQGELKKIGFDPLFSLNHTCAMLRANINRLIRKTWCTTKSAKNLTYHLAIYAVYHNSQLIDTS